jgi:16S rRNA (uracil1498-N3)-methyltransferase
MSFHRFFLTGPLPGGVAARPLPLSAADVHHAANVLRVKAGETIEVVEPNGAAWRVQVSAVGSQAIEGDLLGRIEGATEAELPSVTLFQGVAKGEKMDDVVRQAVEIGAAAIVPVITSRSVVKLDADKRVARGERWRRIAESAAKQAHRNRVPEVSDPVGFAEATCLLGDFDCAIVLWEESSGAGIAELLARPAGAERPRTVALFVGPEGGLTTAEVETLVAAGALVATLGPSVLRTETAALVALALAVHELGGLGSAR